MTWKLGGEVARGDELHRWYDAGVGRWLSQDPIGFAAGDANLYRYMGNGATAYVDPNGLQRGVYNTIPGVLVFPMATDYPPADYPPVAVSPLRIGSEKRPRKMV